MTRIILSAYYCLYYVLKFLKNAPKCQRTKVKKLSLLITMLAYFMVNLEYFIILIKLITKYCFSGTHVNISKMVQFM